MTTPATTTASKSRRALLAGALGGLGAWAASAIGRASPTQATHGDVHLGAFNAATSSTQIQNVANIQPTIVGSNNAGAGLWGVTSTDAGVRGGSGNNTTGVLGFSGSGGVSNTVPAAKPNTGVYGEASQAGSGTGIWGKANGIGVYGETVGANAGSGVSGYSNTGNGLFGNSIQGLGLHAVSIWHVGVRGVGWNNTTGVVGYSGAGTAPGIKAKTGVYGEATQDNGSRGVWGHSSAGNGVYGDSSSGVGVRGTSGSAQGVVGSGAIGVEGSSSNQYAWGVGGYNSAAGGTGVWGQANNGYAFRGVGRLRFDSVSGVTTIAAGNTNKTVTPGVNVTSGSFVLLTPRTNLGGRDLWFTTNATANTITIRMSKSRSKNTKVAWLLLG